MQNFTSLSETEQYDLLTRSGNILISSSQGDMTMTLYNLDGLFVKVTQDKRDTYKVETLPNLDDLKLHDGTR
ncbi:MAG: hypothetical protein INR73_19855 [Williamsia sp.]|nr:hypothetical protein [Williamsia sp.]